MSSGFVGTVGAVGGFLRIVGDVSGFVGTVGAVGGFVRTVGDVSGFVATVGAVGGFVGTVGDVSFETTVGGCHRGSRLSSGLRDFACRLDDIVFALREDKWLLSPLTTQSFNLLMQQAELRPSVD